MRFPSTILVYTDGEVIGDGIVRLAFAAALKRVGPETRLTWLASGYSVYENALQEMALPLIDELIVLPERRIRLRDYWLRPAALRARRFDLIIDTQRNTKRTAWLYRIRHGRFISAAGNGLFSSVRLSALSAHFLTRLLQFGEAGLGVPLRAQPLPLPDGPWEAQAAALLPDGARYIGLVVGAGHPDKCWPFERFMAVAADITARGEVPVFFLGPQERMHEAAIREAFPKAILPLCSADGSMASPYLTIALGRRLTAAIANDSGGGHLLAAADTPLVSLFRSDSVRQKFLPRTLRVIALAPENFGVATMQEIPLDAVRHALSIL